MSLFVHDDQRGVGWRAQGKRLVSLKTPATNKGASAGARNGTQPGLRGDKTERTKTKTGKTEWRRRFRDNH